MTFWGGSAGIPTVEQMPESDRQDHRVPMEASNLLEKADQIGVNSQIQHIPGDATFTTAVGAGFGASAPAGEATDTGLAADAGAKSMDFASSASSTTSLPGDEIPAWNAAIASVFFPLARKA
jgi:hypothetical protein